ncbi:MAG: ribonuclease H family protein [bacterium]|nr:ribonuclease H family protein [bacterium]
MAKAKNNYYAYKLVSGQSGILDSWQETENIVKGKSARYKGFATKQEAQKWLEDGANYEKGKIKKEKFQKKLERGIYFDAGTGRGKGTELKVTDESGKNLLPKSKINTEHQTHRLVAKTNNYGELLACKFAIEIALRKKTKNVFGDSRLVIDYWSLGHIKAKNVDEETVELSMDVAVLRDKFEKSGGKLIHVSGDINPADLGFHR